MVYVPINTQAYISAYAGAIAGMAVSGWIINPASGHYAQVSAIAGAFSEAFDQAWNDATALNNFDGIAIQSICQFEFSGRGPGSLDNPKFSLRANWVVAASACAALVLEGNAYLASQGINPGTLITGVSSWNGRTGAVLPLTGDYSASEVDNDSGVAGAHVDDALDTLDAAISALITGVSSVFGRVGAVVAAAGDYAASQVNNDSSVAGAQVSNALNTLQSTISALVTGVSSVFGRVGAVVAAAGDYAASQVNNDSGVAGTHVNDALNTLNQLPIVTEAGATRTLTAADANTYIRFTNAGGCVVTVNNGVFAAGDSIIMRQVAAGAISFAGTATLTPPVTNTAVSGQQGATIGLIFTTANAADVTGDLADI